jgi:hypothetical protein
MRKTIPTIIAIILLITGVATGVILLQNRALIKIGAAPEHAPKELKVSNVNDNSFAISWITDSPTRAFVKYGESQDSLDQTAQDEIEDPSVTHYLVVKNLKPQTPYYFRVNSEGNDYDTNGAPWTTNTTSTITSPQESVVISGVVNDQAGLPKAKALVYAQMANSTVLSTFTSIDGKWLITLSFARDAATLSSYTPIKSDQTKVDIFVAAGEKTATAKILPISANPLPAIVLGQTHDFTTLKPKAPGEVPNASVSLPVNENPTSKFVITDASASASIQTVTIESQSEGETVNTTSPQFFGEGPIGANLTITVKSDPITDKVTVDTSGKWQWEPPKNLEPGEHTITLSWKDAQGILKTLTRSFTVLAAEGPAFQASSSATLKPTVTPTPTPTPTPIATASATPKATKTPAGSPAPIPVSGNSTPTLLLTAAAIAGIIFTIIIAVLAF